MAQFIKKYKHGLIILVYAIVYLMFFGYLEHRPVRGFHAIDTVFDDYIPFCEYFIVPYLLWFPYQVVTVLYFIFKNKNKKEYYCWQTILVPYLHILLPEGTNESKTHCSMPTMLDLR